MDAVSRFNRTVQFVAGPRIEAGYSDDPQDPGGPTDHGITEATLTAWRGHPCTAEDVKALTLDEAIAIYHAMFWTPVHGDDLPAGVDLIVFDAAVNQGPEWAARFLQLAASVKPDGVIGPQTLAAVRAMNPSVVIDRVRIARLARYESLPEWSHDGNGWTNRLNAVVAQAHAWAE